VWRAIGASNFIGLTSATAKAKRKQIQPSGNALCPTVISSVRSA
jgi:hypothetical protein